MLPADAAKELRAARPYITNESITAAYDRFLEAKAKPGSHSFDLWPVVGPHHRAHGRHERARRDAGNRGPGADRATERVPPSYSLTTTLEVSADGKVNGQPVLAGSAADYECMVQRYFGGKDSDLGSAASRMRQLEPEAAREHARRRCAKHSSFEL